MLYVLPTKIAKNLYSVVLPWEDTSEEENENNNNTAFRTTNIKIERSNEIVSQTKTGGLNKAIINQIIRSDPKSGK